MLLKREIHHEDASTRLRGEYYPDKQKRDHLSHDLILPIRLHRLRI